VAGPESVENPDRIFRSDWTELCILNTVRSLREQARDVAEVSRSEPAMMIVSV
jgi:hypothetical protein